MSRLQRVLGLFGGFFSKDYMLRVTLDEAKFGHSVLRCIEKSFKV